MEDKKQNAILVIDHESDVLEVLEKFIISEGHKVCLASNGDEGIEKYTERKPNVVLLDIDLPGANGIKVLKKLKQIDPQANVIIIGTHRDVEKTVEAFHLGAYDCIFKPFDYGYLKTALMVRLI